MAGGGVRAGTVYGQTDEYGYNIADADGAVMRPKKEEFQDGAVHVHDLQATILSLMGVDHKKLVYRYQGRDMRLTDVHGHVVDALMK
jgi:arylsulfatase A-like enzyme